MKSPCSAMCSRLKSSEGSCTSSSGCPLARSRLDVGRDRCAIYCMPIPAVDSPSLARSLLRDDVYARLRDAIVDGTLLPGERLRDLDLAAWLGVSRTPVREALLRLGQAGLVQ